MQLAVSDGITALIPVRDFGCNLTLSSLLVTPCRIFHMCRIVNRSLLHKRKFFQTFPVIKVMAASNSGGECTLDTFQFLDVSDFCRTPEGLTIFQKASYH